MAKYKLGLVIGRFQPFHLGHKYLIEKALEISDKIIIGIGSSNISDKDNPYPTEKRKKFLEKFIHEEGLENKIINIIPIVDHPDDDVWLEKLLKKTGKFDASIGDNEWVNGIFEKAGIPVVRVGHLKRSILEGTKIRGLMKNKKPWEKRVPKYLVEDLKVRKMEL
jgi:nicotinamide-nucleotide adenylyltransferase